jgi:cyclophilin family peptidyl-prolyl cis-trans isomerase
MLSDQERENYLNGNYAAFGCVTEGMEVVDAIASVEIDDDSAKPLTDVVIETVRILNDY